MAILNSVIQNFDNHLRSGLCELIPTAYECYENGGPSRIELELMDDSSSDLDRRLRGEAEKAREKFATILTGETGSSMNDIQSIRVTIDFSPDDEATAERCAKLERASVWYGYDPVYDFETSVRLTNGKECTVSNTDLGRSH